MSYLKTVVFAGFISRQTIFLLVLASAVLLPLWLAASQYSDYTKACSALVAKRAENQPSNDAPEVGFTPCFVDVETSALERILALEAFVFTTGFLGSLCVDAVYGIRNNAKRRGQILHRSKETK